MRLLERAIALRSVEFPPMRQGARFHLEAEKDQILKAIQSQAAM